MRKDILDSLPPNIQEQIIDLYKKVTEKKIQLEEFYYESENILGTEIFNKMFEIESNNSNNVAKDIKTEKLADIFEYSGIDLKREQEKIYSDVAIMTMGNDQVRPDYYDELDSLVNVNNFNRLIIMTARKKNLYIESKCSKLLFLALRRRLMDMMDNFDISSRIRVDDIKEKMKLHLDVENDIKKQLFVLEEDYKKEKEKFFSVSKAEKEKERELKKEFKKKEDMLNKKKMSNALALKALGTKSADWFDFDEYEEYDTNSRFVNVNSKFTEHEIDQKIKYRKITYEDVFFTFECDKKVFSTEFFFKEFFN